MSAAGSGAWTARRLLALGRAAGLCALLASAASGATVPKGRSLHPWPDDRARLRELEQHGVAVTGREVVALFPADSLPPERMSAIVTLLDSGIAAAKALVGRRDWTYRGDPRVHFYFARGRFVSHAPGGNVAFVPLWRIRDGEAPWIHECMHLLLATPKGDWLAAPEKRADARMPLWLYEGLAEALAMEVSARTGIPQHSPLYDVPPERLDSLAREVLHGAPSERVLDAIGTRGRLPELFGPDRPRWALPFYAASTSFVRYLAGRHGYEPLLAAMEAFDQETDVLEQRTGTTLAQAKAEWLEAIGYTDRAP